MNFMDRLVPMSHKYVKSLAVRENNLRQKLVSNLYHTYIYKGFKLKKYLQKNLIWSLFISRPVLVEFLV